MRISDWSSDVCSSDLDSKGSSILKSGYLTLIYHLSGAAASLRSEPRKRRSPAREAAKTTIRQPKHVARSIVHTFMSFSDVFPHSHDFPSYFFYFFFVQDRKSTRLNSSH